MRNSLAFLAELGKVRNLTTVSCVSCVLMKTEIYRKKPRSGSNLLASMQSITNALSDWLRHVPNGLRIDFANLDTHLNRECVSISLHFYSCVNMTARPLVFYVIKRQLDAEAQGAAPEDWRDGLSQSAVGVIDSCITAARATTLILDAAAKHNRIGMSFLYKPYWRLH